MNAPIRFSRRSLLVLVVVSTIGLAMFVWPLWVGGESELAHSSDAAVVFAAVLAMLVVVLTAEVSSGGMDAKALAMLGVLAAVAAALRPLGAGTSGFQPMFVVLILGGRALGPGFGFLLGLVAMFGSALLTGGVGPWLPFQMLAAGWVGMGAGLLPRLRGRGEVVLMAGYGAVSGVLYGFCLNMWFWPFLTTAAPGVSFEPGAAVSENLGRFLAFCMLTSLGFDLPRALGSMVLILMVAAPLLRSIRRVSRRANFTAEPVFADAPAMQPPPAPDRPPGHPAAQPAATAAGRPLFATRVPPGASPSLPPAAPAPPPVSPARADPLRSAPPPGTGPGPH